MAERAFPDALPTDYRLHWYVLLRALGQGGFGITYLARDTNLDQLVAIKEFLPVEMATRLQDATVRCRTDELRERYRWGLERFIQEARTLARFDHANIVRVLSVFEANDTAYMVMRFEEGQNLATQLERRGTLPEPELQRILLSILDGLELVHNAGFIHRDIKPDNIHIRADGTPVLLDFGSARHAIGKARTLTILVAPGYAPIEQYYSDAESQGAWTDIYGLAATCYRAVTGVAPIDAIARSKGILGSADDVLVPASVIGRGRYSERLLAAIDHGLAFAEKDRPRSIAEWRREILAEPAVETVAPAAAATSRAPTVSAPASNGAAAQPQPAPAESARSSPPAQPAPRRSFPWIPLAWSVAGAAAAAISIAMLLRVQSPDPGSASKIAALESRLEEEGRRAAADREEYERRLAEQREQQQRQAEALDKQRAREQEREKEAARAAADLARKSEAAKREGESKRVETKKSPDAAPPVRLPEKPLVQKPLIVDTATPQTKPVPSAGAQTQPAPATPPAAEPAERDSTTIASIEPTLALAKLQPTDADRLAEADQLNARGDHASAFKLNLALAEKGNVRAQTRVGNSYSTGRGVARDDAVAVSWYRRAADQGDGEARLQLANHLVEGRGVTANLQLAYVWYTLAVRAGQRAAEAPLGRVRDKLQRAEIAALDRLIENNHPSKERSQ